MAIAAIDTKYIYGSETPFNSKVDGCWCGFLMKDLAKLMVEGDINPQLKLLKMA